MSTCGYYNLWKVISSRLELQSRDDTSRSSDEFIRKFLTETRHKVYMKMELVLITYLFQLHTSWTA